MIFLISLCHFFIKARFESADLIGEISSLGLLDIILSKKINFLEKIALKCLNRAYCFCFDKMLLKMRA